MNLDNTSSLSGAQIHQHYRMQDHQVHASSSHTQVQQLCDQHGVQNVAGAGHNVYVSHCCNGIREGICAQSCPQGIKDEQLQGLSDLEQSCMMPCTPDCSEAVANSSVGQDAATEGAQAGGASGGTSESHATQSSEGSASGASASATGSSASGDHADALVNASESSLEADKETKGKGKGKGGNWLIQMAEGLAEIQLKFINSAMEDLKLMEGMSAGLTGGKNDNVKPDPLPSNATDAQKLEHKQKMDAYESKVEAKGKKDEQERREFLLAQSRFQANMQMFNMMANMTATSLKSIGEGMTTLARKQ